MTLATTPPLVDYVENGVTLPHTIPFQFQSSAEIVCTRIPAGGVEGPPLVLGTDYNVTGGGGSTGTVTKTSAGVVGTIFRIVRDTNRGQPQDYTAHGDFPAENTELALDRLAAVDQEQDERMDLADLADAALEARTVRFQVGQEVPILDRSAFAGRYYAGDVDGKPIPATGTGNDTALRGDLATPSLASNMIALLDGTALSSATLKGRRLTYAAAHPRDVTLRQARLSAENIHNLVVGYAKSQSITGGQGLTEFVVTIAGMDPTVGSYVEGVGVGTYAWCQAQAAALGGGKIIIYPTGHFDFIIRDNVQNRFEVGENNITVIAPGRNATFWHVSLAGNTIVKNQNQIFAYVNFRSLPGPTSGDYNGDGTKAEVDLVTVFPQYINKLAFVGCTFNRPSDGACDVASTGFTTASPAAYMTFQDCIFRDADECMLIGANSNTTTVNDTRKLFVTMSGCVWDGCGQRQPKVLGLAMVDMVGCYTQTLPWRRDQPSPEIEYGDCYGASVTDGGWLLVRGCLWSALDGVAGYPATKLEANAVSGETGAIRVVGSAAENGMTFATGNELLVVDPPYIASLPTVAVPAVGDARESWVTARWAAAGAAVEAAPEGLFNWEPASTAYPNQNTVVRRRVKGAFIAGREIRVDAQAEIPVDPGPTDSDTIDAIPRGYSRTVGFTAGKTSLAAIGPTMLDLADADSSYFLVQGNGAAANIKHVIRSDGVTIEDGTVLSIFGSATSPPTLIPSTSSTVTATAATDVIAHSAHGETVSGFQVVLSNSGGALPAPLVANTIYYGIYVDANSYKLALTYAAAIAGTAIDLTTAGTGTQTAVLGSFALANGAKVILDGSGKGQQLRFNTGSMRFNQFGASHPLIASKTFDWPSLLTATQQSTTLTATGAELGDAVQVSMNVALSGTHLWGEVTAANTITAYQRNDTGGTVDVPSGTLRAVVTKVQ